jgi:hypothetical protein
MALAIISSEGAPDIRDLLEQLQLEQFQHDEKYHREIARLGTQDRLKHMALHFAKYVGNLASAAGEEDGQIQRIVTDVFIIGTSTSNILNLRLAEAVPLLRTDSSSNGDLTTFAAALTINMGKMAAACEKLDHLEDFPFRSAIREAVLAMVEAAIEHAEARGWDLTALVRERLRGVKEKMIFHGRV